MSGSERAWIAWIRETTQRDPAELPAMPSVAVRLVDLLNRHDVELEEVEHVISQDQAIATRLIQAANSVLYRGAMPAETVARAAMRLGLRETAQVAMAAAYRTLYDPRDRVELETHPDLWGACWQDSLVCAFGGRLVARELKLGEPERVFLRGMFRHVGNLLVLKMVVRGLVAGQLPRPPEREELAHGMNVLHTELGARYLHDAEMPDYVVDAAARHHDPDLPFAADTLELHVLRIADGLCAKLALTPLAPMDLGAAAEQSAAALHLDAERLEYLELQFAELAGQVSELL